MASDSPRKRLKEEATCFVCWDYYINPLFLDCGHSFCQACVSQCWKDLPDNATCPQCKTAVQRKNCHLNSQLANVVEIAKQLNSQLKEEVACGEVCEEHPKPSTAAFCKEDQVAFCWMCDGSQQHSDHNVVPMEVAAQEYKDCFSGYVEMLKKERAESVKVKCITLEGCEHLLKQTNAETQLIADVFRQLHGFLSKQENYLMLHVEPVAREITKKKIHDLGSLTQDIITLENTIRQLEEKCSQPANELLRDAEMILERCRKRSKFHKPEDFSYKLKWKRWELLDINALMRGLTQFFTDTLQNACFLQKAHVTLDADSSHPQLVLSPDAKSSFISCGKADIKNLWA
ncbi:zinc finger protein RFP-like [Eublepharis macularius]|uniref:Zinc finger protein RFP-like n=1 Tax=Eublepharis macularius TaxID=481883 RepID=A0AA97J7W8_EUBMA|nr:zinc finger protein RFP-like [Eublepharis macularius]